MSESGGQPVDRALWRATGWRRRVIDRNRQTVLIDDVA